MPGPRRGRVSQKAGRVNGSAVLRCAAALQVIRLSVSTLAQLWPVYPIARTSHRHTRITATPSNSPYAPTNSASIQYGN